MAALSTTSRVAEVALVTLLLQLWPLFPPTKPCPLLLEDILSYN